jgi:hypothetical protein
MLNKNLGNNLKRLLKVHVANSVKSKHDLIKTLIIHALHFHFHDSENHVLH